MEDVTTWRGAIVGGVPTPTAIAISLSKTIKSATKNAREGIVKEEEDEEEAQRGEEGEGEEVRKRQEKKKSNSAQQLRNRGMASYWPFVGPLDNTKVARAGKP